MSKLLKVVSIIWVIFAGIGVVLSVIAISALGAASSLGAAMGATVDVGMLTVATIISIAGSAIALIAAILGIMNSSKPEKAQICIIFGCLVIALSIISTVISLVSGGTFDIFSFIIGLIIPVLYLIGAFQLKKSA